MRNRRRASDVSIGRIVLGRQGLHAQATATGDYWLILLKPVRQTFIASGFRATPTKPTRTIAKGTCSAIRVMNRLKIMSEIGPSTRHSTSQSAWRLARAL